MGEGEGGAKATLPVAKRSLAEIEVKGETG